MRSIGSENRSGSALNRLAKFALILVGTAGLAIGIPAADVYFAYHRTPAAVQPPLGPNAVWAEHAWVGAPHRAAAYDALAEQLRRHRITDVFFHVGPLDGDGTVPPERYPNARALLAEMERRLPGLRLHAWIGQRERAGGGPLDLSDPKTRANIVRGAMSFLELGFVGIHYNIEPLFSGNRHLPALLDQTASAMAARGAARGVARGTAQGTASGTARSGILSLSTYEVEPFPGAGRLLRLLLPEAPLWSRDYYREVIARVDQAAVMMYDTALPRDWLFAALVARETRILLDLVDDGTTLFMGVPSYEDRRWNFDPAAENLVSGLRGVRMGLASGDPARLRHFGIAIYARWTTDAADWAAYRRLWLGQP